MTGRRINAERGGIAVEFGVMFPVIALLITGSIWFGVAFSAQLNLTQAAREAVRVYALTGVVADAETTAEQAYGGPGSVAIDAGLIDGDGEVDDTQPCDPASPGSPPDNAGVHATTTFEWDIAFMPFPSIPLSSTAVMRCGG